MLVKYVRQNGNIIGAVVAISRDKIGVSVCNKKDQFSKQRALEIACGRANVCGTRRQLNVTENLPYRKGVNFANEVQSMRQRAERYFK